MKSSARRVIRTVEKNSRQLALRSDKRIVFDYYERHKTEFRSKADAAYRIFEQNLVPVKYSTIYTWLDNYLRKMG